MAKTSGWDREKPFSSRRGVVHGFRNDTKEPATCLYLPVLGPVYFREMSALLAAGTPDPAKVKATMLRHGLVPASTGECRLPIIVPC